MAHPLLDHAALLRSGKPTFTGWMGMKDPMLPDLMAREDFDSVTLDLQHGMLDVASALSGVSIAAGAGKPAFVRIPVADFTFASRALDFGAMGIIAPMINSVEDAKKLVAFTKYPPLGERSWGPVRAIPLTGLSLNEYLKRANDSIIVLAMIETKAAFKALDGILAVEGIDGVFVGPSDLSIALSNGAEVNANSKDVDKALDTILKRAKKAGKLAAAFAPSGARAGELAKRGYNLLATGTDSYLMQVGVRAELKAARGVLGQQGKQAF